MQEYGKKQGLKEFFTYIKGEEVKAKIPLKLRLSKSVNETRINEKIHFEDYFKNRKGLE